ncbi:hypothetical protein CORC01_04359 [Colletotrichum orchidophilum]|uniref:DUF2293 domain-containing protein n=1 Tax=Colletotrichum orchidophilum TaxID=1209926 RepID=A0A1G4BG97_9PEZI|nr:uncharacterized protein CORC01_04359 [Colletotrichum orchidophilum]OHF00378.1 hypothetical protein CORC01_04359 [Colletotrichum orchidophilum]
MGREKKTHPGPGTTAKDRHKKAGKVGKAIDRSAPLPPGLVAAKPVNVVNNSKHQSYFEFIENKDKKKPLLFQITTNKNPPPGMRHIPLGNPELTERCKDISRETGASVYIVTMAKNNASDLSQQIHRVGHHIREYIVDRALEELGLDSVNEPELIGQGDAQVEKIPEKQNDIDKQADAALRELFPRIPNTDRQQIIDHAFQKGTYFKGDLVVGLQQDLSLSRRVQLAVLAHIRHNHTRYDELLRETTWHNARRATEQLCLDFLVKWRGDDENGRNQLDEILREVVVLSDDSDDEDSGEEPDSESSEIFISRSHDVGRVSAPAMAQNVANHDKRLSTAIPSHPGSPMLLATPGTSRRNAKKARRQAKHRERNFSRYEAAANAAWNNARQRQRGPDDRTNQADNSVSHGAHPQGQPVEFIGNRVPIEHKDRAGSQLRLPPAQPGGNSYETRQHMDDAFGTQSQLARSQYFSSGPMRHKVNEAGGVPSLGSSNNAGVRARESHQLQDFLHPSIEPRSPDAVRSPSRYSRGMVEFMDRRGDELYPRLNSPPLGPMVREERYNHQPQIHQSHPIRARPLRDGQDIVQAPELSYRNVPRDSARPVAYQPMREYGPPRPQVYADRITHREDNLRRRQGSVMGERANPIMIEDHNVHPGTVVLGTGESVRDRFGPNVEILAVHRPIRDGGPDTQRFNSMDEGFIRLRENNMDQRRLEEEGFLRLRERPIAEPRHSAFPTDGRSHLDGYRTAQQPQQYRPAEPPGQAIYVRRVERPPPADLSYSGHSYERVETVRNDSLAQRRVPSPAYRGAPYEHHHHHSVQGAYGVPVHRHAMSAQRLEDSFRSDRHRPSPPRASRQWPRANDDVIVLE